MNSIRAASQNLIFLSSKINSLWSGMGELFYYINNPPVSFDSRNSHRHSDIQMSGYLHSEFQAHIFKSLGASDPYVLPPPTKKKVGKKTY